jgi:hypothetical protein
MRKKLERPGRAGDFVASGISRRNFLAAAAAATVAAYSRETPGFAADLYAPERK